MIISVNKIMCVTPSIKYFSMKQPKIQSNNSMEQPKIQLKQTIRASKTEQRKQ